MFISTRDFNLIMTRLNRLEKRDKVKEFVMEQGRVHIGRRLDVLTRYLRDPCNASRPTFVANIAEAYEARKDLLDTIGSHGWFKELDRWDISVDGEDKDNG